MQFLGLALSTMLALSSASPTPFEFPPPSLAPAASINGTKSTNIFPRQNTRLAPSDKIKLLRFKNDWRFGNICGVPATLAGEDSLHIASVEQSFGDPRMPPPCKIWKKEHPMDHITPIFPQRMMRLTPPGTKGTGWGMDVYEQVRRCKIRLYMDRNCGLDQGPQGKSPLYEYDEDTDNMCLNATTVHSASIICWPAGDDPSQISTGVESVTGEPPS